MRKIFIALCLLSLTPGIAQKLYFGAGVGAAMPLASGNIDASIDTQDTETYMSLIKGSYGKGLSAGLFVGYNFSDNFSAQIGFNYLSGAS